MLDHPYIDALRVRFWEKVQRRGDDECWPWTAVVTPKGYGMIGVIGHKAKAYAHRVSYEFHYGPITDGLWVLHSCDNPRCVNPAHLYEGTHSRNARDAVERGRHFSMNRGVSHCKHGHEFTVENTHRSRNRPDRRVCKACAREHSYRSYLRRSSRA